MTLLSDTDQSYQARAAEQLRRWILDGTLAPGSRLNEVALAHDLGISRGPLREALQRVAAQGLVEVVRHRGTFVRTFRPDQVTNLYEVRIALERAVVARLARLRSAAAVAELTELLDRTAAVRGNNGGRYPDDLDFHAALAELAGNPDLAGTLRIVNTQLALARGISGSDRDRADAALAEHRTVAAAIAAGDEAAAEAAMRVHLERSRASTLAALAAAEPG